MATKKKTGTEEPQTIDLNVSLDFEEITIPIVGVAPLIVNKFGHTAESVDEVWDNGDESKQKAKKKKIATSPEEEFKKTIYYLSDGVHSGFPAVAFKAAMVRAAKEIYGVNMNSSRLRFHVLADDPDTGLIQINGEPRMRFDSVRVGGMVKTAAPRYRAEYPSWSANVTVRYLSNTITKKEIVSFLNAAGFCCGIGEWRPEKCNSGSFGLFQVAES